MKVVDFDGGYYQYRRWYSDATSVSVSGSSHVNPHSNERVLVIAEQ